MEDIKSLKGNRRLRALSVHECLARREADAIDLNWATGTSVADDVDRRGVVREVLCQGLESELVRVVLDELAEDVGGSLGILVREALVGLVVRVDVVAVAVVPDTRASPTPGAALASPVGGSWCGGDGGNEAGKGHDDGGSAHLGVVGGVTCLLARSAVALAKVDRLGEIKRVKTILQAVDAMEGQKIHGLEQRWAFIYLPHLAART